ncbi:MAG: hypothetical protein V4712_04190 [Pseudomonadota bacterium]
MRKGILALMVGALAGAVWAGSRWLGPRPMPLADFNALYAVPLAPPAGPVSVYHLGHSLVGADMPAMLAQLAEAGIGAGHDYASQLGWGASLMNHWQGEVPGFAEANATPAWRDPEQALASGEYGVVVLTEMVEIRDAIRYHDSPAYLARWAARARAGNPAVRVYLYETWHWLDHPDGWLERIDRDLALYWEAGLLRRAMLAEGVGTIYVIPGGQVMAAAARAIEAGQVPGLTDRTDLFARRDDGTGDSIHFNDLGAYLMALTHYAVIYGRSPVGLPPDLRRADGTAATPLPPGAAEVLQELVWQVVTGYAATGVAG